MVEGVGGERHFAGVEADHALAISRQISSNRDLNVHCLARDLPSRAVLARPPMNDLPHVDAYRETADNANGFVLDVAQIVQVEEHAAVVHPPQHGIQRLHVDGAPSLVGQRLR